MTLIHGLEIDGPPASPELAMAGRPGQIPAQLVGHTLFYFTQEGDLVFDPMAGGGVVPDTCLAFNRRCWSFDLVDRPETRPEIEPHQWNPESLVWPVKGKEKPDLIFFDPPYFKKREPSIQKRASLCFLEKNIWNSLKNSFLSLGNMQRLMHVSPFSMPIGESFKEYQQEKKIQNKVSFFQTTLTSSRPQGGSSPISWIAPCLSELEATQRFLPNMVSRMQRNRTLGVVRRSLIIGRKK